MYVYQGSMRQMVLTGRLCSAPALAFTRAVPMERRTFLATAALAAASVPVSRAAEKPAARAASGDGELIDTNVYLSSWAVRRSWAETPAQLVEKLRRHGVTSAWTGSFEGVLHTDMASVNARLAEACAREGGGVLRAFGTVNPALPD